jgi:Uncharacterized membrane protein (homolog of Drosophila rhomboid)
MENYYSEVMSKNSDKELQDIIANRNCYEDEAYIAAIDELQKRDLVTDELLKIREELLGKRIEEERKVQIEKEERKVERKKAFKEAVELLKPTKKYFYTPILVYLNVAIFIIMVLSGVHPFEPSVDSLIQWGGNLRAATLNGQLWRLLTNVFLHGGLFHLLFNMYALLYVGGLLEKKFGKHRFILVYIITGVLASIASISYNENIVAIGASGAIFGIYGLFLALLVSKNYRVPEESRQNLISSILVFIGYNLFYGFTKEGIDNAAHIGGLVSGFIIGFAYYPAFRIPRYSKFISSGLVVLSLIIVFLMPKFIHNPSGEFRNMITEFTNNENKALWMYREKISNSPEKTQYYYDRLKSEGIELWNNNLRLLNSLSNLPPYLKERVDILNEYCNLRIESCKIMQSLIKYNNPSDQETLNSINIKIESEINKLKELNK